MGLLSLPLLLEGAALPSLSLGGVFGWGYFSLLFCWVVLLGPLRWVVLRYSFSPLAWCCLPFPPFGGAAFSPSAVRVLLCLLLLWEVLRSSSPPSWCCLPSPPSLSEAAFSPSSVWWCFIFSPSSLGGAAFSPSSAGRCCLTFSFFGWCFWVGLLFPSLLLGGAALPPPSLSGVALFPLLLCGAAFLPLLP